MRQKEAYYAVMSELEREEGLTVNITGDGSGKSRVTLPSMLSKAADKLGKDAWNIHTVIRKVKYLTCELKSKKILGEF